MESVQVERFYLGCLAHASYMVGSGGVAAVIDPQRDVEIYLQAAAANGWKIEHIIETHVHADFVSGHRELAEHTGAQIYLGAGSGAEFRTSTLHDRTLRRQIGPERHFQTKGYPSTIITLRVLAWVARKSAS